MKNNYTYFLRCQHCVGTHCKIYYMKCNILGKTKKFIKLEIIGERYWKCYEQKRRIRYLPLNEFYRLRSIK